MSAPYAAITFLTYEDLEAGERFYEEILGFPLVEDQGWAKVYRICPGAYVGLVSSRGEAIEAPVGSGTLLSITVDNVNAWYERLKDVPEIKILNEPSMVSGIPVYSFFLTDPAGYRVEIQAFTDPSTRERFESR
jgi:lactoylglutathione lyase